jgi:hypothetical protein
MAVFCWQEGAWGNLGPPEIKKRCESEKGSIKKKLKSEKSNEGV